MLASNVDRNSTNLPEHSAFICLCLVKSSGNGYLFALNPSQIFTILFLALSPAKKTTYTVLNVFSPVVGSSTCPSMFANFKNTFPLVARNKTRSNACTFSVLIVPVINPNLALAATPPMEASFLSTS
jgi:hypothetical protein